MNDETEQWRDEVTCPSYNKIVASRTQYMSWVMPVNQGSITVAVCLG